MVASCLSRHCHALMTSPHKSVPSLLELLETSRTFSELPLTMVMSGALAKFKAVSPLPGQWDRHTGSIMGSGTLASFSWSAPNKAL